MIYREGLPDSYLAFENNDLVTKVRRPVNEMVITYEPKTGAIEVIADGKECREELVKLFSATLLQSPLDEAQRVPLKKYDISKLLQPCNFTTDPEDGIEQVKVMMLALKPYDMRTIEVTSPTASYNATDQTTDFGSAQSSVDVKVYQLSAVIGRGYAASATI